MALPLAAALASDVSCDAVLEKPEDEVVDLRLYFASSRGTYGPPANEHGTPCLTQFEQGDSSLHCECDQLIVLSESDRELLTFTCLLLHCAHPFRDFL